MEILREFGVDIRLLLAQIVNFLVILFVLKKFLYKPILTVLRERKELIAQGLKSAQEAEKMLENARLKEEEVLQKAAGETKKLLDEAKIQAKEIVESARKDTVKLTAKMLSEAKAQIQEETRAAEQKLGQHVSRLAVEFLKKSLTGLESEKVQAELMAQAVKKMKEKTN